MSALLIENFASGAYCRAYAIIRSDQNEIQEFFEEQAAQNPADSIKLHRKLNRLLDIGEIKGEQHCKSLRGKDCKGLWELRAGSLRLIWFWDAGRMVICTNGFTKKSQKTPTREIQKAKVARNAYLSAKKEGRIREK